MLSKIKPCEYFKNEYEKDKFSRHIRYGYRDDKTYYNEKYGSRNLIYHLCIIDYLQDFNNWKKAEYFAKNILKNEK